MMFITENTKISRDVIMSMVVFVVNYQCARVVFSAISIANVATSFLNLLFIVLAQQRHYKTPPSRFWYCIMCYNISTYKTPPKVPQSGLEPEYRLHGSAFQKHRVCHFTTGASAYLPLNKNYHILIVLVNIYQYMLHSYNNSGTIVRRICYACML